MSLSSQWTTANKRRSSAVGASLYVMTGHDRGRRFHLTDATITIGRDVGSDIRLNDTEVSRRHAEIRRDGLDNHHVVVDLGSSNGTFVNSEATKSVTLTSGDRVQVGRTLMIYTNSDDNGGHSQADNVDIVAENNVNDESRIVTSLANDQSGILGQFDDGEDAWLRRARSNLQIMYRTALAASHTMDIDELLRRIMEMIFEWVEADRGCVMLLDQESNEFVPKVRRNRPGVRVDDRMSISRTIIDYVTDKNQGVLTSDARDDRRWDAAGSIVKMGVREAICVPMQGRYGVVGLIYVDTFTGPGEIIKTGLPNRFNEDHLKLMIAIGHQAALAVEDTSYYSAMVQAERLAAIGQTIAGLSHHVKNILQGIRGGSYLIEEGLKSCDQDVVRKGWGIVDRNQEKISRLVLDMLTFSKEREPELVPADLNQVVGEVVELMQSRAADLNVDLSYRPDALLPTLTFDPEGIHHAILNIVTNAIDACEDASPANVHVATRLDASARVAQVIVKDTGRGIEPENLQKVFSLFESTKGNRGTGLGLSVSQKIVSEHGGQIKVASQKGIGSTFTLEIPATLSPNDSHDTLH